MKLLRFFGVKAEVELVLPSELEPGFRECVVTVLSTGMPFCEVCGVGGELVGDHALLDVLFVRQTEVFLGSYIAEHRGAEPSDHRCTDSAGDVVVTRGNVRR